MGVVFRAVRADGQVQQEVALKIVKRALLDASGRERFLREREIVAAFQHPSIARMLDVGETADGSPYLAMELIRWPADPPTSLRGMRARQSDARRRIEVRSPAAWLRGGAARAREPGAAPRSEVEQRAGWSARTANCRRS